MGPLELILAALQLYFMLMNLTVERFYCHTPLLRGDARFLVPETLAFCEKYNPLFLLRPEWMRVATCVSAYVFSPFYALILLGTLTGSLHRFKSIVWRGPTCCRSCSCSTSSSPPKRRRATRRSSHCSQVSLAKVTSLRTDDDERNSSKINYVGVYPSLAR
ncbi:hypothetical protein T492DRAFT_911776 [Pavlovales sp. CCMP2436]|nr:hypothetical protein T492DRAFT_911776 [Pavlovales sp. CCMP2436]